MLSGRQQPTPPLTECNKKEKKKERKNKRKIKGDVIFFKKGFLREGSFWEWVGFLATKPGAYVGDAEGVGAKRKRKI